MGLANPPTAVPAPNPNASIGFEIAGAFEVTQAIQDRANSLPLVEDKKTVARVYVDVSGVASAQPCFVYVYGSDGGVDLPGSPHAQFFVAPTMPERDELDDIPYFILPDSWPQGSVEFRALVRDFFGNETFSTPITLEFTPTRVPLVWVIPLNTGTAASPVLPSNTRLFEQERYLETVYPVADVRFVRKSWQLIGPTTVGGGLADLKEYHAALVLGWLLGFIFTGESPFELPDQSAGFTSGLSDGGDLGSGEKTPAERYLSGLCGVHQGG